MTLSCRRLPPLTAFSGASFASCSLLVMAGVVSGLQEVETGSGWVGIGAEVQICGEGEQRC